MVFSAGSVLTASALNDATLSAISSYTPTVANGGTVTWTTRTGWYYRIGTSHLVYFNAYLVVNAAGSGSSQVTITAPSNIDRTTQQVVPANGTVLMGVGAVLGVVRANTTGSGAVFDAIVFGCPTANLAHSAVIGSDLQAGGTITMAGWYREA
jgi:hypothetical protein